MPPRMSVLRSLPLRSAPSRVVLPTRLQVSQRKRFADSSDKAPPEERPKGPNQDVLPHVSEEAAQTGKITGEGGPEMQQGTPIQEVLERDKDGQEKAPQVLQPDTPSAKKGARSYATLATASDVEVEPAGHKFGLPALPLPTDSHLKHRYDPVIEQVTNLLMRDGKKSVAQRNMSLILSHLRTAPAPTGGARATLPGAPPPSHLPLNPIMYLTVAIDSVAPLLRIRSQKGAAGGGVALQIPVPLRVRQRRRKAMQWILDAVEKKRSRGSGKDQFAHKVAEEIVAVMEGRSGVWEKRGAVHKLAVAARANMLPRMRRK